MQVFKLDPFQFVGQINAPKDIEIDKMQEASGITAIAVSRDGMIAVSTFIGNVFVYTFENLSRPQFSINLKVG